MACFVWTTTLWKILTLDNLRKRNVIVGGLVLYMQEEWESLLNIVSIIVLPPTLVNIVSIVECWLPPTRISCIASCELCERQADKSLVRVREEVAEKIMAMYLHGDVTTIGNSHMVPLEEYGKSNVHPLEVGSDFQFGYQSFNFLNWPSQSFNLFQFRHFFPKCPQQWFRRNLKNWLESGEPSSLTPCSRPLNSSLKKKKREKKKFRFRDFAGFIVHYSPESLLRAFWEKKNQKCLNRKKLKL